MATQLPAVSFKAPDGTTVSLTQTGPWSAWMVDGATTYNLENVVVDSGKCSLAANVAGEPMGVVPHVVFQLYKDDLRMTISKSWIKDGVTDIKLTDAETASLEAFLKAWVQP